MKKATQCNVVAYGNRCIVERDPMEAKTKGGIWLPDRAKKEVKRGTVVHVGPDNTTVKAGDKVMFCYGWELDIPELPGRSFVTVEEQDLQAILLGEGS